VELPQFRHASAACLIPTFAPTAGKATPGPCSITSPIPMQYYILISCYRDTAYPRDHQLGLGKELAFSIVIEARFLQMRSHLSESEKAVSRGLCRMHNMYGRPLSRIYVKVNLDPKATIPNEAPIDSILLVAYTIQRTPRLVWNSRTNNLTRTSPGPGFWIGSSSTCVLIIGGSE
jgi:hypothetical protein